MKTNSILNKVATRDSLDDEENSDDVDDEVFIRDGRNGFKFDEDQGVKRPLMAPRRKIKFANNILSEPHCEHTLKRDYCYPIWYSVILLLSFLGFLGLVTFFIILFPLSVENLHIWSKNGPKINIIPCTEFKFTDVWTKTFPRLRTESAIKLMDVNGDNIDDVIAGFGAGTEKIGESDLDLKLDIRNEETKQECGGGVMALDGKTGEIIWRRFLCRTVRTIDCGARINNDSVNDCLISGRGGVLALLSGMNGGILWRLPNSLTEHAFDIYSSLFIPDIDGDGYQDVITTHVTGDTAFNYRSNLNLLSGHSGDLIKKIASPANDEVIFNAPRLLVLPDGEMIVILISGDSYYPGALYAISLSDFIKGDKTKSVTLYRGSVGISVDPIFADVNLDGTEDILIVADGTIVLIDALSQNIVWNKTLPSDRKYYISSPPTPGYFNDDNIPDFFFTFQIGSSFLVYYYSINIVLDGKTGEELLGAPIISSSTTSGGAITLSYAGIGNDLFLYPLAACIDHETDQNVFYIFNDGDYETTDLCNLRFNTQSKVRLLGLSQHLEPPGVEFYSSVKRWTLESRNTPVHSAKELSDSHPEISDSNQQPQEEMEYQPKQEDPIDSGNQPRRYQDLFDYMTKKNPQDSILDREDELINMIDPPAWDDQKTDSNSGTYPNNDYNQDLKLADFIQADSSPSESEDALQNERTVRSAVKTNFIPKISSTAALARSIRSDSGIDVIYVTHRVPTMNNVIIYLEKDKKCVKDAFKEAKDRLSKYYGLSISKLEEAVKRDCLEGGNSKYPIEPNTEEGQISTALESFSNLEMAQMTVYRIRVDCFCRNTQRNIPQVCSSPLPLSQQSWSSYLGNSFNAAFKPRLMKS